MVGQLAEVGNPIRLVHGVLRRVPDHGLLHGHIGEDSTLDNFGTGSFVGRST